MAAAMRKAEGKIREAVMEKVKNKKNKGGWLDEGLRRIQHPFYMNLSFFRKTVLKLRGLIEINEFQTVSKIF